MKNQHIWTKWGIKVDRRVRRTKKAIEEAYFELLALKGEEKITIAEIARRANVDRKTFYLHYESVDSIIREFAEEKTKELLKRLTIRSFFTLSFDKTIFAKEAGRMLEEHMDFCKMLATAPGTDPFWNIVQETTVQNLTEIYARHSRLPKEDLLIQVTFFVAGVMSVYRRWLQGEIPCSREEIGDKVSEIAFFGVQSILKQS